MRLLLPLAVERGTRIITNMGASERYKLKFALLSANFYLLLFSCISLFNPMPVYCSVIFVFFFFFFPLEVDPLAAQEKVIEVATSLGLNVSVGVAHEVSVTRTGNLSNL